MLTRKIKYLHYFANIVPFTKFGFNFVAQGHVRETQFLLFHLTLLFEKQRGFAYTFVVRWRSNPIVDVVDTVGISLEGFEQPVGYNLTIVGLIGKILFNRP